MSYSDKVKNIAALEQEVFANPWTCEMIDQSEKSEFDRVEVLEKDGVFQGYIIYSVVCDSADLLRVAVKPEFRRLGVAGCLMQKMMDDCGKGEVQNIFLEVRESNTPAIEMYKKYGFFEISKRKNYYRSPVEDGIVMQKMIKR